MKDKDLTDGLLEEPRGPDGPVTCLGMTFESDAARRAHFTEELRKKLRDPEFRKVEGFPIGEDEDILNLSDPPYYTACPNPWIGDFIAEWEAQKPEQQDEGEYHREPFAADISEGKTDQLYRAHTYHTKVPYKAIMRYILHYTEPGDIVFDGFCGSGMTGIAAQLCGSHDVTSSLGYKVNPDGEILSQESGENGKKSWKNFSKLGARKSFLNDLSPAATFVAAKYNSKLNGGIYERVFKEVLGKLESEIGWMYETLHADQRSTGKINYTVWSEILRCTSCQKEMVFLDEAFESKSKTVLKEFPCPGCGATCSKSNMDLCFESKYDAASGGVIEAPKRQPVLINYSFEGSSYEKKPDENDRKVLSKIGELYYPQSVPTSALPKMQMANVGRMKTTNTKSIHHFFLDRQAHAMGRLWELICEIEDMSVRQRLLWTVEQSIPGMSILNRHSPSHYSQVNRQMAGIFYVPSQISECSPWFNLKGKIKRLAKVFSAVKISDGMSCTFTGDCAKAEIQSESIDYIFTDPPFGENIYYSDLNLLVEAWHGVKTSPSSEAIVDRVKNKTLPDYQHLIENCFKEYYRVLKSGRWITVEFSNTQAAVWNSIQTAMSNAGFIVANVSALDKKQHTFQSVNTSTAVKQDLIISAYKPDHAFSNNLEKEAKDADGVWGFVEAHLRHLPVAKREGGFLLFISERDPRILHDQVVAYYVRKGHDVPISSREFQSGLSSRFSERDGMYFLPDQAAEYDRKKKSSAGLTQSSIFVSDEESAIQWLRQKIEEKPPTISDITPLFMQQLGGWKKNEARLDLRELLSQNFLCYEGDGPVPEAIHAYLSSNWKGLRKLPKDAPALVDKARGRWYMPDPAKATDMEKLRENALLKEFEEYKGLDKKVREPRKEAVRAGFKRAWQDHDYDVIIRVAEKIPSGVLEEDSKLLMWYDQALTRVGEKGGT